MSRRWISLVLAAVLLASSSGLLLAAHLHEAEAGHDSSRCEQCLQLHASGPAVIEAGDGLILDEPVAWPVSAAPIEPARARVARAGFASRAPPLV